MTPIAPFRIFIAVLATVSSGWSAENSITTRPEAAGDGVQVGISKRDGVTVSGADVYVSRNGITEKLVKELKLPSGVIAMPDGKLILPDKSEKTLGPGQLLTFEGQVVEIPNDPNVNPAPPVQPKTTANGTSTASPSSSAPMTTNGNSEGQSAGGGQTGSGNFFLGSDGTPFSGTLNENGTITTTTGTVIPIDGSIRGVMIMPDGRPTAGRLNRNGAINLPDGSTIQPDGSMHGRDGKLVTTGNAAPSRMVSGTMFMGSDGLPFKGTANPNGTITTAEGVVLPMNGSTKAITFNASGAPTLATVNSDGSLKLSDGSTRTADGSLRTANGAPTGTGSPANSGATGAMSNSNAANANGVQNGNRANNGANPNNPGTNQLGTNTQQGTPTQQGTTNQQPLPNGQQRNSPQGGTGTGQGTGSAPRTGGNSPANNGAAGGPQTGGAAGGAGGASGGGAPGGAGR